MTSVLWGKPSYLPGSIKIAAGTVRECRRELKVRQREGWRGLRIRPAGDDDHRLFTRLDDSDRRFKRMILAHSQSVRKTANPVGELFGWDVWVYDGKAYLFREGRTECRICDWFDLCHVLRIFGLAGY